MQPRVCDILNQFEITMRRMILIISINSLRGMRIGSTLWWMGELLWKRTTPPTQIQMRSSNTGIIDCIKYKHCDETGLLSHFGVYLLRCTIYHIMMA